MKSITQSTQNDKTISNSIAVFFRKFRIYSCLKAANAYKTKGFPVMEVFRYLFCLIFENRSMYMQMLTRSSADFAKDTVYRFLNDSRIHWRRFTTLLSARIISGHISGLTDKGRINVFIFDDTLFERLYSRKAELLSKVYDHAKRAYKYGFRLLTLGWSDGNTFLPVNGCLLSTENRKNRINEAKTFDKRSNAFQKRDWAMTKAPTVVLDLLKAAKQTGIAASHMLFDTWFCSPSSLLAIRKHGYDVIAMAKKTSKMHYLYNGKMQPLTEIYRQNRKRRGRSRYLLSVEISIVKDGESVPARAVFVRNRNKRKDYLCILTTDMGINEDEIIRIYGKRWDIEVFFKVCKSYLRLSRECHSLSYDAMTAHVAIVFTRYMMLSVENRRHTDNRTLGEIFFFLSDELSDITWIQAMHLLIQAFINTLSDKFSLAEKELDELMDIFMSALPTDLAERLARVG